MVFTKLSKSVYTLRILSICLLICFVYPINVKTAEPIGSKFCGGHQLNLWKVYRGSKFQKLASNKIQSLLNFKNPQNFL